MEAIKNFYRNYICLNLNEFENIKADLEINKVLFFIFLALCAACFVLNYYQSVISLFLRKLIRSNATSENDAKTLSDLGLYENKTLRKLIIKDGGIIKRAVTVIGLKKLSYEEYTELQKRMKLMKKENKSEKINANAVDINFDEAKFYMNEEQLSYAEHAYKINNGSVIKTVLYCLVILAFYFMIVILMPSILKYISNILA